MHFALMSMQLAGENSASLRRSPPFVAESVSVDMSVDPSEMECSESEPMKRMTDDVLCKILHLATPSFASVYRLKTVCKRWQQILDSVDWRYSSDETSGRHSCVLKYQWCNIDGNRGQLKFFCLLEQRWFLLQKRSHLSGHWTLVASEGALLCYQSASRRSQLCVDNPLKTPGFLLLPPIPHFDDEVTHEYGQSVSLIVKRRPDRLKIVLTVFPESGDSVPSPKAVSSTFSVVFDSTEMKWTMFRREPSQTPIRSRRTFFLEDIIFFPAEPKPFQKLTSLTLARFHTVTGEWDETTIDSLPCYAHKPLNFFQSEGRVYLLGSDCCCDYITVWRLETSASQFFLLKSTECLFTVHSTMPRPFMDRLYVGRSYGHFSWKYVSFEQTEGICLVSERHQSQSWFTYSVNDSEWKLWNAPGKLPNKFHRWFSWESQVFPLVLAGVEL